MARGVWTSIMVHGVQMLAGRGGPKKAGGAASARDFLGSGNTIWKRVIERRKEY
jgi:hypothetical protein